MKILSVEPRDLHVIIDLSLSQVEMLLDFMSNSKINCDSPDLEKAAKYVVDIFFKQLSDMYEDVRK